MSTPVQLIVMPFAEVAVRTAQALNAFAADFKEVLPAGAAVKALMPLKGEMQLIDGTVSETQFDKGNMPDGGLIIEVSQFVWAHTCSARQCGRGRICVPWTSLRVEA